jgi:hypothetical protein
MLEMMGERGEADQLPPRPIDLCPEQAKEMPPVAVVGDDLPTGIPSRHDNAADCWGLGLSGKGIHHRGHSGHRG